MIKFTEGTQKQVLYDYLLLGKAITTKKAMIDFIEIVKKIPATMLQRVAESIISIKKSEIQILTITQNVGKTKKKITLQINTALFTGL